MFPNLNINHNNPKTEAEFAERASGLAHMLRFLLVVEET